MSAISPPNIPGKSSAWLSRAMKCSRTSPTERPLPAFAATRLCSHGPRGAGRHSRSMIVTLAWPPPSHMVTRP
jgi:hypothetical protein